MPALLKHILKRGLFVAVVLAIVGYMLGYLMQLVLSGNNVVVDSSSAPVRAAAIFAGAGFALLAALELLAAGMRAMRGPKPGSVDSPRA